MVSIRAPKTVPAATRLCERFVELDGAIAEIEERRRAKLAAVNAEADCEAQELVSEHDQVQAKLADWWSGAAAALTEGKRKSVELGGAVIGSRTGVDTLSIAGDEKAVIAALEAKRWAKPLLIVSTTLNRRAILDSLDGGHKADLAELGLSRKPGVDAFTLKRVVQGGTIGKPK